MFRIISFKILLLLSMPLFAVDPPISQCVDILGNDLTTTSTSIFLCKNYPEYGTGSMYHNSMPQYYKKTGSIEEYKDTLRLNDCSGGSGPYTYQWKHLSSGYTVSSQQVIIATDDNKTGSWEATITNLSTNEVSVVVYQITWTTPSAFGFQQGLITIKCPLESLTLSLNSVPGISEIKWSWLDDKNTIFNTTTSKTFNKLIDYIPINGQRDVLVRAKDQNNCLLDDTILIFLGYAPPIELIKNTSSTICPSAKLTITNSLNTNANDTYDWYYDSYLPGNLVGSGLNSKSYTNSYAAGNHKIILETKSSCIMRDTIEFTVDPCSTKQPQTISGLNNITKTILDPSFSLTGSSSSTLMITYTSSDPSVASVSGNVISINGFGTTTITASQSGDNYYEAANDVSVTLTVTKASQTISGLSNLNKWIDDNAFSLNSTSSSGLEVSYSSSNNAVASIVGNVVTIAGAGTSIITASQAGNAIYDAASDVTINLVVSKYSQTIPVQSDITKLVSDAPFVLDEFSSSGLPISYTISNTSIASITNNVVTIHGPGSTIITATQAGNNTYAAAQNVVFILTVNVVENINAIFENKKNLLYPNPALHYIYINTNINVKALAIFDVYGNKVLNQQFKDDAKAIDISRLAKGVYTLQIVQDDKILSQQFIKE